MYVGAQVRATPPGGGGAPCSADAAGIVGMVVASAAAAAISARPSLIGLCDLPWFSVWFTAARSYEQGLWGTQQRRSTRTFPVSCRELVDACVQDGTDDAEERWWNRSARRSRSSSAARSLEGRVVTISLRRVRVQDPCHTR